MAIIWFREKTVFSSSRTLGLEAGTDSYKAQAISKAIVVGFHITPFFLNVLP
jgi:hypothetical protein